MFFKDRKEAGILLAKQLLSNHISGEIVLGLARGGVAVARSIADELKLPCDVLVVKKIPAPDNPELAIGAVTLDNVSVIHEDMAKAVGAEEHYLTTKIAELNDQVKRKTLLYRNGKPKINLLDKTVILVDDGAATGATIEAAMAWVKKFGAKELIVALPIVSTEVRAKLSTMTDKLAILEVSKDFSAVGQFYEKFDQVEDEEVVKLLHQSAD